MTYNEAPLTQHMEALPRVPPTTKVQDNLLAVLLHAISVTGLQATLLTVPGASRVA